MLPAFIIIGTMKGGTSSLYHYLDKHPDIGMSSIKETDFFRTNEDYAKGIEWYKNLFDKKAKILGEASPNYTKRHLFPGVPERMYAVLPRVKLIYLLRDPIERIVSHYIHSYSHRRERSSFIEAITKPNNNYILTSKYFYQLQVFIERFSSENILLIESEELRKNTDKVINIILEFIGADLCFHSHFFEKHFHQSSEKLRRPSIVLYASRYIKNAKARKVLTFLLPLLPKKKGLIEPPVISTENRNILIEHLSPDIEKLRAYSGLSFSSWSL
ncbi:sulfotransferase [Nitrosococcus halophilus Nc 4]|uniref:Sulfotransferase n=1 Tax=Nitrosococcus halophilus (strain Nc4) TaxID=472759 RepID=D5C0N9_NITHN|nr:sulfotransferase domain-containing protein [Nitrosococcus halophilus]ADE16362.1 sulfotransferase [Nitrosococcus halophilus Nc 4]